MLDSHFFYDVSKFAALSTPIHFPLMLNNVQGKGKGKGTYTWYSASSWNTTSEALRYGSYMVTRWVDHAARRLSSSMFYGLKLECNEQHVRRHDRNIGYWFLHLANIWSGE